MRTQHRDFLGNNSMQIGRGMATVNSFRPSIGMRKKSLVTETDSHSGSILMGAGWGLGQKGEGIKKGGLVVTKRSQVVEHSVGDVVSNVMTARCQVGTTPIRASLCSTPETTNAIPNVICNSREEEAAHSSPDWLQGSRLLPLNHAGVRIMLSCRREPAVCTAVSAAYSVLVGYGGPKSFLSCVSVSVENRWYVWKHNNSFKIVFGLLGINTSPWSLFELNPLSRSSPGRVLQSNLRFLLALFAEEALLGAPLNSRKCPLSSLVFWDTDSYLSDALTKGFGALPSASAHTCLAAPPLVFTWKRFLWFFDVICLQERQTFPNPSSLNSFMINTSLSSFSAFSSCFRQQHWRTYFNICLCVF